MLSRSVAFRINGIWGAYAILPRTSTVPETRLTSPSTACKSVLSPDPTEPMTQPNVPRLTDHVTLARENAPAAFKTNSSGVYGHRRCFMRVRVRPRKRRILEADRIIVGRRWTWGEKQRRRRKGDSAYRGAAAVQLSCQAPEAEESVEGDEVKCSLQ